MAKKKTAKAAASANSSNGQEKNSKKTPFNQGRTRNFATVVYPSKAEYEAYYEAHKTYTDEDGEIHTIDHYEGTDGYGTPPEDWRERLAGLHVTALISPMHIADHNPDGSVKKPHYHVMLMFDGVKSYDTQVKPMMDSFGGVGREEVNSARGYARYLLHLDNPEKFQYDEKDITQLCGADYKTIIELPGDKGKQLMQIHDFINRNDIHGYAELLDALRVQQPELWYPAAFDMTYTLTQYLKSRTWQNSQGGEHASKNR